MQQDEPERGGLYQLDRFRRAVVPRAVAPLPPSKAEIAAAYDTLLRLSQMPGGALAAWTELGDGLLVAER